MMLCSLLTFTASWLLWAAAVAVMGGDFGHVNRGSIGLSDSNVGTGAIAAEVE